MSNYYAPDPFENAWGDATSPNPGALTYGFNSGLAQSSAVLSPSPFTSLGDMPSQYQDIRHKFPDVATLSQFDTDIVQKVVQQGLLTPAQAAKVTSTVYDNLMPLDDKGFLQALGVLALELESESGDYVTLQYRMNNLPELPEAVANLFLETINNDVVAPVARKPKSTSLLHSIKGDRSPTTWDPLLTDRSLKTLEDPTEDREATPTPQAPPANLREINTYLNDIRARFNPLSPNEIHIKELPEREGIVFKHTNYNITHNLRLGTTQPGQKSVVRRYLDFVWLLEFLLKKYPFRVIPGLPPKKFNGKFTLFLNNYHHDTLFPRIYTNRQ